MEGLVSAVEKYLGVYPPQLKALLRSHLRHYNLPATIARELAVYCVTSSIRELANSPLLEATVTPLIAILQNHWAAAAVDAGTIHPALQFDLILYHSNCPDGLTAAWCFWRHNRNVECVGMKYGQPPPDVKGRRVAVVDFSFPRIVLEQMKLDAAHLRVWDHHETARDDLEGLDYCTFDMKKAGCELSWEAVEGETPMPYFVQANADHDVWRKIPDSEAVSRCLREQCGNNFENYDRLYTYPDLQVGILAEGRRLLIQDAKSIAYQMKFSRLFNLKGTGYIVRVGVPPANLRSEFGEAMCLAGGCDFSLSYVYALDKGEWWLSLRSSRDLVNVSQIAKEYFGGGGHAMAAGGTLYERTKGQYFSKYFDLLP